MALGVDTIVAATALGLLRVYLLFVPGVVFALWPRAEPILQPQNFVVVSRLFLLCWSPALSFSALCRGTSWESLKELWLVPTFSCIRIIGGFCLARLMFWSVWRLSLRQKGRAELERSGMSEFWVTVIAPLMSTFNNSAGIPLPLFEGLCAYIRPGAITQCEADANLYIFLNTTPWVFLYWCGGFVYLRYRSRLETDNFIENEVDESPEAHATSKTCCFNGRKVGKWICDYLKNLLHPVIIASVLGIGCGMWPQLKHQLYGDPTAVLYQLGATITTVGSPTIPVASMIFAATFVHSVLKLTRLRRQRKQKALRGGNSLHAEITHPSYTATSIELAQATTTAQRGIEERMQPCSSPHHHVPSSAASSPRCLDSFQEHHSLDGRLSRPSVIRNASISLNALDYNPPLQDPTLSIDVPPVRSPTGAAEEYVSVHSILMITITVFNLVVAPGFTFLFLQLIKIFAPSLLPDDALASNIIIMSSGMPAANIFIVVCHSVGLVKEAQKISYVSMFMMLVSVITIPLWLVVALYAFPPELIY